MLVLTDLRPGDEVVIVLMDDVATAPSAATTGAPSDPSDASELLVFRETEAP